MRDPDVAADDRLDSVRARRFVELDEPELIREIGKGERRHRIRSGGAHRVVDSDGAVRDREFAVQTQMNEGGSNHGWIERTAKILLSEAEGFDDDDLRNDSIDAIARCRRNRRDARRGLHNGGSA